MHTRGVPVHDDSGNIVGWICALNDITERREAENLLRQQAELLDQAHDTIMVNDMDETIRFWSRGAERMYGFTNEQAIGKSATALLNSEFPQPFPEILAALEREGWWEGEVTHHASNGDRVLVASRWVLQRDSAGKPVGILKSNNNITERKRTEEALHATESRFRKLFESDLMGIAIPDRFGGFLEGNDELLRIADSGIGIPTDLRPRLFEPFVSTKESTGVGLGLWVSRGIVQKHRGRIALRSSTLPSRHGTVVALFFPFDPSSQAYALRP